MKVCGSSEKTSTQNYSQAAPCYLLLFTAKVVDAYNFTIAEIGSDKRLLERNLCNYRKM